MKKQKKIISLLLILALMAALFGGCASDTVEAEPEQTADEEATPSEAPIEESAQPETSKAPAEEPTEPEPEPSVEPTVSGEIVRTYTVAEQMPLTTEDVTLTAWDYVVPPVMSVISDYGTDGLVYKTLQVRTGVKLEFNTANLLTASSSTALMVAANELPDITFDFGMFYSGSKGDLVEGDIIIDYCDYEDVMPNYFDIITNNPNIARDIYTDNGYVALACNI